MPRISSLRSSRDGAEGTSPRMGAAASYWPTASSITSRNPGKASSICARSIPPCNKLWKYAMSGVDAASGLGDVGSAANAGSGGADGFFESRRFLDYESQRHGFLHLQRRLHLREGRATGRVRQGPALDDRAYVEASVRRHRCDAHGEIAALLHLAIECRDPTIDGRGPLVIARRRCLERHAACIFRKCRVVLHRPQGIGAARAAPYPSAEGASSSALM